MVVKCLVKGNTYYDSAVLMLISNKASEFEGILQVSVLMGTVQNKRLLKDIGLLTKEIEAAGSNDLVVSVDAETEEYAEKAITSIEQMLVGRRPREVERVRPRTLDSALKVMPDANFAVISVPGAYAGRETITALREGLNVFLFSDNVGIEDELKLKQFAEKKGLMMMGPGCGTAIINNVVLGFGNAVHRGPVGVVGATGTGIQEVTTLIDKEKLGISQAIGTGGRDMSNRIGGIMIKRGIEILEEDKDTKVIVVISKPPERRTEKKILETLRSCKKPIVVNFIGSKPSEINELGATSAVTLEDAAMKAVAIVRQKKIERTIFTDPKEDVLEVARSQWNRLAANQKYIRGLYSGGTLCSEALLILTDLVGDLYSNIPFKSNLKLKNSKISQKHTCIDMGEEEFTIGRPHPMIDPRTRCQRIVQEAQDQETALVLLDIVLGYGSHPDPAGALIPKIQRARAMRKKMGGYLPVVVSLVGTDRDPQSLLKQSRKLASEGIIVMPSNAQASRMAALIATRGRVTAKLFGGEV